MITNDIFLSSLTYLYGSTAIIAGAGYLPQIIKLIRTKDKSLSNSITTWMIWTFTSTVSFLYAIIILKDPPFILVALANMAGCSIIFILVIYNRYFRFRNE